MHAAEEAQHLGLLKAMGFELPLSEYRQRMAAAQGNFQVRDTHHDNQTNTRYCDKHPHSINNTLIRRRDVILTTPLSLPHTHRW